MNDKPPPQNCQTQLGQAINAAIWCAAATVMVAIWAAAQPVEYGWLRWLLIWMAGGLFQLTLMALAVGSIVRAIWFLPGVETREREIFFD